MKRKKNQLTAAAIFTLAIIFLATASAIRADDSECVGIGDTRAIRMKRVTYLGSFNSTQADARADKEINNGQVNYRVKLTGWLYYPEGLVQDRPVIIFNHGHAQDRPEPCSIAKHFVGKGFVVFAPLRRGHRSITLPGFHSTGIYIETFVDKCMRDARNEPYPFFPHLYTGSPYCRGGAIAPASTRRNAFEVDYIRSQHEDVREQIRFIKEQSGFTPHLSKLGDPGRIAVLGHSWGGSLAIFSNQYDYGQNVAIDISGAELSWGDEDPFWQYDLTDAMNSQKRPTYFLQPNNGLSLKPTRILFSKAVNKEYRSQATIFSKAPWDPVCASQERSCWDSEAGEVKSEARQAHESFLGDVDVWGLTVADFIERHWRAVPE